MLTPLYHLLELSEFIFKANVGFKGHIIFELHDENK